MASWYPKACRSITSLCFAVDASDQSVSRYCKRLVPILASTTKQHCLKCQWLPPHDDSDDEVELRTAQLPSALPPVPVAAVQPLVPAATAMLPGELSSRPVAVQPQTWPGRQVRATRNKQSCYLLTSQEPRARPAICQKQTMEKTGSEDTSVGQACYSGNARRCSGDVLEAGTQTQMETRCCTSTPTAQGAAISFCMCCLAKCDWPGRRCLAAR
jgi:hypothetical protein